MISDFYLYIHFIDTVEGVDKKLSRKQTKNPLLTEVYFPDLLFTLHTDYNNFSQRGDYNETC